MEGLKGHGHTREGNTSDIGRVQEVSEPHGKGKRVARTLFDSHSNMKS